MAQVIQKVRQRVVSLPSPLVQGIAGFFSGFIVDYVAMQIVYAIQTEDFKLPRIPTIVPYWWLYGLYREGGVDPSKKYLCSVSLDDAFLQWIVPLLFLIFKRNMLIFGIAFAVGSYMASVFLS